MLMKFIDREAELAELRELHALSRKKKFVVAFYGLRRVGKTRLLLEFIGKEGIYFFVNKNKTSSDLLGEYQQILRENKLLGELEALDSWEVFARVITTRETPPIVFDEFQNFTFVEPSVFGILQKNLDLNEDKPGLIIVSGSLIGLMKRLFRNSKEPLYGRIKKGRKIEPLALSSCFEVGEELRLNREELVKLYLLFGGYPKYYVVMEDFNLRGKTAEEIFEALLLAKDAPLEDEVNGILSQEFGGRSGVYYSILESIANGNNTLSSIAGSLNTPITSITRQVNELKDLFELIELELPYEGKRGVYRIRHPLLEFWFSQIYRNYSDYSARKPEFISGVKNNFNRYFGRAFERAAAEFLFAKLKLVEGKRQWGRIKGARKEESAYEIDFIGKNGASAFAFEFKWKRVNYGDAKRILESLRTRIGYLGKREGESKLGIVARKIDDKPRLVAEGYLAYDLDDF